MRLRQLAISQSVVFFAPPEVHQSILNFRGQSAKGLIDSRDVIAWLLEQTCCSIEQIQPLYISQGLEYCRRRLAAQTNSEASFQQDQRKAYLKVLEQPERYSLENLYAPDRKTKVRPVDAKGFPEIAGFVEKLNAMKKGFKNTGDVVQALTHQGPYILIRQTYTYPSPLEQLKPSMIGIVFRTMVTRQLTFNRGRAREGSPD